MTADGMTWIIPIVRGAHGPAESAEVSGDTSGSDANGWLGTGSPLMKMQTVHHVGKRISRVQLSIGCCGERFITGEALLTLGHPLISSSVIF